MNYTSVIAARPGGPEVLQVVENDLRPPAAGEARLKVLAAAVCRPDVTLRRGTALYSGTPLGQKFPFVPGYAVIGVVDALGPRAGGFAVGDRAGALTVTGGYSEYLYRRSDRLIPVPVALDPVAAVPLVLNYIVAYQALHRSLKVRPGEKALILGASGGLGTAILQLGRLAGLQMYGLASQGKHAILAEYGATPIDYQSQRFAEILRRAEPGGLDVVLDGVGRLVYLEDALSLLHRRGRLVSYGEPASLGALARTLALALRANLRPDGKSFKLYGTSAYFLGFRRPFLEDWATLFGLLAQDQIRPVIQQVFPLLEAAQANALLESGQVTGNVVLAAPELL